MLDAFERGGHKHAGEFSRFLSDADPLGKALRSWALTPDRNMDPKLLEELVGYSASLLCMQRLEAKHHLVHQRMSIARNSTPSTLSANLRRALNTDVHSATFKAEFSKYLMEFHLLVDEPWQSRSELARLISGYHLELMFQDLSKESALIASRTVAVSSSKETLERAYHLKTVLEEGSFYAIADPDQISPDGSTPYLLVQLVTFSPGAKRYMEKVVKWVDDPWHGKRGVVNLGKVSMPRTIDLIDCDERATPQPLPPDFCFSTTAPYPTEMSTDVFFKADFDYIYKLHGAEYKTVFAPSAITRCTGDEDIVVTDLSLL